jgi:hypothetical protein
MFSLTVVVKAASPGRKITPFKLGEVVRLRKRVIGKPLVVITDNVKSRVGIRAGQSTWVAYRLKSVPSFMKDR